MKVIEDFKDYLGNIDKMSRKQRKQLEVILTSMLVLLISLMKSSGLGQYKFNWDD